MITQDELKEVLHYDPETGIFRWRMPKSSRVKPWDVAGTKNGNGYICFKINGASLRGHRLAWLYMTGKWPENDVDHMDGNRSNNAWQNLRSATNKQNLENQGLRKNNTSRFRGVSWCKRHKKWVARVYHNYKQIYVGFFESAGEAGKAASAKRAELYTHDSRRDQVNAFV